MDLKPSEMKLADTVRLFDGAYGYGVVSQIANGQVSVFRPFAATSDFSYTGGVIPYVGIETVMLGLTDTRTWPVTARKDLR